MKQLIYGKLIALEGPDGSGKATQAKLLYEALKKEGWYTETIDFPQYSQHFGALIRACLDGAHGDFLSMDPYVVSTLYAGDRFESRDTLRTWLSAGAIVVADRYVSSNQLHQGSKIIDENDRAKFLRWLAELEFGIYGLPRPDKVLYLDVPFEIGERLLEGRAREKEKKGENGRDLVESNKEHLEAARKGAKFLLENDTSWTKIECAPKGEILSPEKIHETVRSEVDGLI